ncbi:MAG: AMP-binding protein [Clostridia bacterium]|nr:AMP-binding protein [Clostridia bacterium]
MATTREYSLHNMPDLRELFYAVTGMQGTSVAFHEKKQGFYQHISYGRFREEVEALGTALGARLPGEARILIIGKNSYHMALALFAAACGAGLPVPVDETVDSAELSVIIREAGITAVLYDPAVADKIKRRRIPVKISMADFPALIEEGRAAVQAGDESFCRRAIAPDAPAAIFYTAGTTGRAKGVQLSHRNILATLRALHAAEGIGAQDIFLSHLPLSHAYECVLGLLFPFYCGASVAFAEGIGTLMRNMREIHPTAMVTIPYFAERIYDKFWQLTKERGTETGVRRAIAVSDPVRPLSARQSLKERLLREARLPFGGALRTLFVVGDFLPAAVCKGLRQIGMFAAQGYGITECAGLAAINTPECYRDGSVGRPLEGLTFDLYNQQPDGCGEIRIKGDGVMLGYDRDDTRTNEALRGGWYYTGDLGRMDEDGFLYVIGRKQNGIECADGTLVSPEALELLIRQNPLVGEVVVAGVPNAAHTGYEPAALILPDTACAAELFGIDFRPDEIEAAIGEWLGELNATLAPSAAITLFALRETPLPRNAAGRVLRAEVAAELAAAK